MQITINEIDGSIRTIEVERDDTAWMKVNPAAFEPCKEKGILIYKDAENCYYLIDNEGNVLASHPSVIRTYINMFVLK